MQGHQQSRHSYAFGFVPSSTFTLCATAHHVKVDNSGRVEKRPIHSMTLLAGGPGLLLGPPFSVWPLLRAVARAPNLFLKLGISLRISSMSCHLESSIVRISLAFLGFERKMASGMERVEQCYCLWMSRQFEAFDSRQRPRGRARTFEKCINVLWRPFLHAKEADNPEEGNLASRNIHCE